MECPHQIWRAIAQSRMFSIHSKKIFSWYFGIISIFPPRTASIAGRASSFIAMNHWRITSGSSIVPQRSWMPTACVIGSCRTRRPFCFSTSIAFLRAASRCAPARMPAWPFILPSLSIALMIVRLWRWPISKSVASWPGVTLSAPVPNCGSTASSVMIFTRRSTIGTSTSLPTYGFQRSSSGCTATATSATIVSGRVVATMTSGVPAGIFSAQGYFTNES